MRVTVLVENTTSNPRLTAKHGLSLHIATSQHQLLVDVGPDASFAGNAARLGIDIAAVDTLVITHGHSDHGGGLSRFLKLNQHARVFVQRQAFDRHYTTVGPVRVNISLNRRLREHPRVTLVDGDLRIDDQLMLICRPAGTVLLPEFNRSLLMRRGRQVVKDDFDHEQSVLVRDGHHTLLIGGCAHRGIINIVDDAVAKSPHPIDVCVSGFHMYSPTSGATESPERLAQLCQCLCARPMRYYTCHCTGLTAHQHLQSVVPGLGYLAVGDSIDC